MTGQAAQPTKTVDYRGLMCPEPVFKTKMTMDSLRVGDLLEVFADDPAAELDITSWAKRSGQELLELEKKGKDLRILLKKAR